MLEGKHTPITPLTPLLSLYLLPSHWPESRPSHLAKPKAKQTRLTMQPRQGYECKVLLQENEELRSIIQSSVLCLYLHLPSYRFKLAADCPPKATHCNITTEKKCEETTWAPRVKCRGKVKGHRVELWESGEWGRLSFPTPLAPPMVPNLRGEL